MSPAYRTRIRSTLKREKKKVNTKRILYLSALSILSICAFAVISYFVVSFCFVKTTNSVISENSFKYFINRRAVTSTLVVIEGSVDQKIAGAWYVVNNDKTATSFVYYVPPGVYMKEYSRRVDEYVSVADLKYVGNVIDQNRDIEYAIWQLSNLTGITIDGYIWLKPESLPYYTELFGDISEFSKDDYQEKYIGGSQITQSSMMINSFVEKFSLLTSVTGYKEYKKFVGGVSTNLSNIGMINRIKHMDSRLDAGGVYMIDLTQPWATYVTQTATEREINMINYPQVDKQLTDVLNILKGREIEKEQVKVEVYNGSGIEGLAGRYYRKLRNAGLEVVRYENAPSDIDNTTIYIPKPDKYKESLALAKELIVIDTQEILSRPDFMTTGDIVIILGKDMMKETIWE